MSHRLNRIALSAGVTVAVIAAMAAPASARATAGVQASTPVPIDVTGDIAWTWQYTPLSNAYFTYTGADKQTGTFRIDLTGEDANGNPTGDSSTYSITDNDNITSTNNQTGCTSGTTGSFSGSGSFPLTPASGTPYLYAAVTPTNPNVDVIIGVPFTETQTETFGGPSAEGCSPGSSTGTVNETAIPTCLTSTGGDDGDVGVLQGTYPKGIVSLSCSPPGTYNSGTDTGSFSVTGTLTITPSCSGATGLPAPSESCPFTVDGDQPGHPVESNSSQDTHATDPNSVCNPEAAKVARDVGQLAEAYMLLRGAPDGAGLLRHFLADSGDAVEFPQGSAPSNELAGNPSFVSLKDAVLDEIGRQLELGLRTVDLNGFLQATTPPALNSPIDLYYAFRGTQGITVSGSGTVNGDGSYSGTLTYTILDSYGFTVLDALNLPYKTGALMRYLQINCGDNLLGAHWFPDYITLTQNFSGQL